MKYRHSALHHLCSSSGSCSLPIESSGSPVLCQNFTVDSGLAHRAVDIPPWIVLPTWFVLASGTWYNISSLWFLIGCKKLLLSCEYVKRIETALIPALYWYQQLWEAGVCKTSYASWPQKQSLIVTVTFTLAGQIHTNINNSHPLFFFPLHLFLAVLALL